MPRRWLQSVHSSYTILLTLTSKHNTLFGRPLICQATSWLRRFCLLRYLAWGRGCQRRLGRWAKPKASMFREGSRAKTLIHSISITLIGSAEPTEWHKAGAVPRGKGEVWLFQWCKDIPNASTQCTFPEKRILGRNPSRRLDTRGGSGYVSNQNVLHLCSFKL